MSLAFAEILREIAPKIKVKLILLAKMLSREAPRPAPLS